MRFTAWRSLAAVAVTALMAAFLTPAAAHGAPQKPRRADPSTPTRDAVREAVWVDTGLDGDGDGKTDRVAVDIVRPREPAQQGRKVPVIMDASPYYSCCGRGNESQLQDVRREGRRRPDARSSTTTTSCRAATPSSASTWPAPTAPTAAPTSAAAPTCRSAKAVVDWLNGRARAYTTRTGTTTAKATWTNGKTGMIGKCYDGTIANGVAATGVKGLKTIVPISAISSWYDYYFAKGAPLYDYGPDAPRRLRRQPRRRSARCAAVQREARRRRPAHRRLDNASGPSATTSRNADAR